MSWWHVIVLAVLQGLTELPPVSSSGHLAIASRLFFNGDAGGSFIAKAWFSGLFVIAHRGLDYRMGWYVIMGTIPIGVLGLVFRDQIRTGARDPWLIAGAEYLGRQTRHEKDLTWRDSRLVGLAQGLALVPGVSRSSAAISAGLPLGVEWAV
jgi:undecaprenyl-diphosphatase